MSQNRKLSIESLEDRQVMTAGLNAMLSTFNFNIEDFSTYQSFINPVQLNDGVLEIAGSECSQWHTLFLVLNQELLKISKSLTIIRI